MKTPDQVLALIKKSIDEAVNDFGAYSFKDKGPWEVMDYDSILNHMKSLELDDARKVLEEVLVHRDDLTGEVLTEYLLDDLEMQL